MLSSDDSTQTTGSDERTSRPPNRRDSASGRRQSILQQKQTDSLPQVNAETPNGKIAWRQLIQLREENKRLRWELAEFDKEMKAVHSRYQQVITQYENQIQEMVEERNDMQAAQTQLERRYQQLYHDFQSAVEEEAQKMVVDAARTIELSPADRPVMLNDVMKTVELHVRQVEDKHTAEALYLMRQAQRKAAKLENELTQERQQIAIERQNLHNLQNSAREQAELRKRVIEDHLRAQYTLTLTLMTTVLLLVLPILQIVAFSLFKIHLTPQLLIALFAPLVACLVLATIFSYVRSSARIIITSAPHKDAKKKSS